MRPPPRLQIKWHFAVIRTDCTAQRLPRVSPDRRWLWGSDYKRRLMWLACFWAYPYILTCVCTVYNEGVSGRVKESRCQTLTSHKFSWPSQRRYFKCGSISQISHVAYICTKMPPKSIGCLEMDVNTNLYAIYPSPFGCRCSVTRLKGHERVFNLSWVSFTVRSPVVPRGSCVRERVKNDGIKRFCNKMCRREQLDWL